MHDQCSLTRIKWILFSILSQSDNMISPMVPGTNTATDNQEYLLKIKTTDTTACYKNLSMEPTVLLHKDLMVYSLGTKGLQARWQLLWLPWGCCTSMLVLQSCLGCHSSLPACPRHQPSQKC